LCFDRGGVSQHRHEEESSRWSDGFDAIDAGSFLPVVVLCDPSHRYGACRLGLHQEALETVNDVLVPRLLGFVDALLDAVHMVL
jgi:hypothetical protein